MTEAGILVVGGGFLGWALASNLAGAGQRVTVLSPRAGESHWPDGVAAVSGRQEDNALTDRLLAGHATVIHAAWGTTPGSSAGQPTLEAAAGLMPFLAFLDSLQRFPQARLLFLSSGGTVYGEAGPLPAGEDRPLRPLSCHGAGKVSAEAFLGMQGAGRTVVLRPANIYGPGQALRSGFGVIRHLLMCAAEDRPFQLWGDGMQLRDYLFIGDFTDAVMRLTERPDVSGVFNLGSGAGTSLLELVDMVEQVTGREIRIDRHLSRPGDVERIVLDIASVSRTIGWKPTVSLQEGIGRTWQWLRKGN